MRFVYQLMLFLIFLNVFLVLFAGYFPGTSDMKLGNDAIEELRDDYEDIGSATNVIIKFFTSWETLAIFGTLIGVGIVQRRVAGASLNGTLLLGLALFISVLISLWQVAITTFSNLNYNNNSDVTLIFTGINICTGIVIMWTIGEFLMGQQGVEAG